MINKALKCRGDKLKVNKEFSDFICHHLTKGEFRESVLIDVLSKVLPFKYGITYGEIICADEDNNQSRQQDIIIYDRLNCPRITLDMENGISFVPVESVFCIIEVKSTLTLESIRDAQLKYDSVTRMPRHVLSPIGLSITGGIPKPVCFLFAYTSSLSLESAKRELKKIRIGNSGKPHLSGIVALDKGMVEYHSKQDIMRWALSPYDENVVEAERTVPDENSIFSMFTHLLINILNQMIPEIPDLNFYMINSSKDRLSTAFSVTPEFYDDETYVTVEGNRISIGRVFRYSRYLLKLQENMPKVECDLELIHDNELVKKALMIVYVRYLMGDVDSFVVYLIEHVPYPEAFETVIEEYVAGNDPLIEDSLIYTYKKIVFALDNSLARSNNQMRSSQVFENIEPSVMEDVFNYSNDQLDMIIDGILKVVKHKNR